MLVQFRVRNFMSLRDEQVFSLVVANGLKERDDSLLDNVVTVADQLSLVKTAVVYGANASGKSNLLHALEYYIDKILYSSAPGTPAGTYSPFVLDQRSAAEPTLLEAVFVINEETYRYGFEIQQQTVLAEWLYIRRKQEAYVFERSTDELRVNRPYKKLQELRSNTMVAPWALLVNLGALFNDETCQYVLNWATNTQYIEGTEEHLFKKYTIQYLEKPENKQRILSLLRNADLGIEDIELVQHEYDIISPPPKYYGGGDWVSSDPSGMAAHLKERLPQGSFNIKTMISPSPTYSIRTTRTVWNPDTNAFESVSMLLNQFESQGTQKFFNLIGLILYTLDIGGFLIADELDTKLHPLLTQRVVQLFNSSITNPRNAQFVFATHDTNLLSAGLFRRDQIWFTEKDHTGATQLYALTDYKPGGRTVRNDEQLEKNYIAGKYGGIPFLGNFDALFEPKPSVDETLTHG